MSRQAVKRGLLITLGVVLGLVAIAVGAVLVLSNTDWGRERVRRQLVSVLGGVAEGGQVRIGRLDGNLLTGATATDISITDSAGAPFLTADSAQLRYDVRGFLRQELHFNDVRLVNALVVLDKPPGGEWNFARIFPSDTTAAPADTAAGWGDRIQIENLTVVSSRVIARQPWAPDDSLTAAERAQEIADALGPETRQNIVAVPGGWQTVYDFRDIDGRFPLLQIAAPDSTARIIEVATLDMEAYPFKPPAAEVRDLRGRFLVTGDSLWWEGVNLRLPGSQIAGPGKVAFDSGATALQLRGAPIATGDLRWLYPRLPAGGTGTLDFTLRMAGDTSLYAARNADVRLEGASLQGDFGLLDVNDTLVFQDTDLRFAGVDTRLIERLVPDAELPRSGTLAGRAAVTGPMSDLRLDADVTFDDRVAGRNRVLAEGGVGVDGERLRMEDLRVDLRPLQVALLRDAAPDLPLDGTVVGNATMDGVVQTGVRGRFDLTHRGSSGTSHVTGRGSFRQEPTTYVDVDAQLQPLSLVTVGRFAPAVGLRGTARGPLNVQGTLGALRVDSRLVLSDGGRLAARGVLDLNDSQPGYDLRVATQLFNANAVVATAPRTSVTATAAARGRGVDPATMTASLRADLQTSSFDTVAVDSAKVRVSAANGLARVDTLRVHGPSTVAEATGTFGLRADRSGELTYRVAVDSLHAFAAFLGVADTTTTPPRPAVRARALARARLDSAARDVATLVQRAAVGGPPPTLEVEEVPDIPNDSVGGSLFAAGTATGNVESLTVNGRAAVLDLVARGNVVNRGRVEYTWLNGLTPQASLVAATHLDSVRAAGFALDSVDARVAYQGERGVADVVIAQDTGTDYSARATFRLALDENELLFEQLAMRFDTTRWVSQQPGRILWGQRGVFIDSLHLAGGDQRRIFVNGLIPSAGEADLELSVTGFQIAHLTQLLQSDVPLAGDLSLDARVTGPATAPRMAGALGVTYARYDDADLPDVRSTFTYGNRSLGIQGQVTSRVGAGQLATITGTVPVDLAFKDAGPRLPDQPMEISLDADSLPLDILGELTDAISDVDGSVTGALRVRGTTRNPVYAGALSLADGRARIVPAGIEFHRMSGLLRLQGDTVTIDSLVGFNTGRVLVRGGLDITQPTQPGFDLYLVANDATVLDNDVGRVRADAGLAMRGPFDAAYISGAATVKEGVFHFDESSRDVVGTDDPALFAVVDSNVTSELALLPEPSPLLENLRMDVALGISRNTWVRSENANVEIFTPDDPGPLEVSVDRARNQIALRGVVTTELGEYRYLGKRFEVDRGSVVFTGTQRIDPLLQVTGRYEVRLPAQKALTIRILIGGTLESPQLSLESDAQPPLPQSDLLSYLAFGRTSSSLLQLDGSGVTGGGGGAGGIAGLSGAAGAAASQRVAALFVSALVESAESGLARSLGADVLTITPADVSLEALNPLAGGFGSFLRGTEVEAGRYVNPRTFVSVIARPSVFSGAPENRFIPGVRVQHRFTPAIRLEASYEGRYVVQAPTLERTTRLNSTGVFGVFLIREWGW